MQWIKEQGCSHYDLSGIDKSSNPGTYSYKVGFCGKNGHEIKMMRQYQICKNKFNELVLYVAERGFQFIKKYRTIF